MDRNKMFKIANLIFASQHAGVIGSLYFLAEETKDGKKAFYRGRIRLCHEDGPAISLKDEPEEKWELGDEDWFKGRSSKHYGDILKNKKATLNGACGKLINEKYTTNKHNSRGVLLPYDKTTDLYTIQQEHIVTLLNRIDRFIDATTGECKADKINDANEDLITLTAPGSPIPMPAVLRQQRGIYGC